MSCQEDKNQPRCLPGINTLLEGINFQSESPQLDVHSPLTHFGPFRSRYSLAERPFESHRGLNTESCHESFANLSHESSRLRDQRSKDSFLSNTFQTPLCTPCTPPSVNKVLGKDKIAMHTSPGIYSTRSSFYSTISHKMNLPQNLPPSPVRKGWFDPVNEYSKKVLEYISGWDRDQIYEQYFFRDPQRQTYGSQPVKRPSKSKSNIDFNREIQIKIHPGRVKHSEVERGRRDRHRECQRESHARCCEMAMDLSEKNMSQYKETKCQSTRGPGKDDQLLSTLFMFDYGAIALQSENEGRKNAEACCSRLVVEIERLCKEIREKDRFIRALNEQGSVNLVETIKKLPNDNFEYRKYFREDNFADSPTHLGKTLVSEHAHQKPYFYRNVDTIIDQHDQPQARPRKRRCRTPSNENLYQLSRQKTCGSLPSPSPSSDDESYQDTIR